MPRHRSTRARSSHGPEEDVRVPRDYRVTVSYESLNPDEPLSYAVENLERGRDFKVLSAGVDDEGAPRVTVSFIFNTCAATLEDLHEAIYNEYDDQLAGPDELVDHELIRVGVSSNLKQLDDTIALSGHANALALGQNGTLNAELVYDIHSWYTSDRYAHYVRKELFGEHAFPNVYGWDRYHPYNVYKVREDSDLICRMIEHNGEMRWLTVGTESQVLGIEPFEHVPRLIPVDPVGPPPYTYSMVIRSDADSRADLDTLLRHYYTSVIGLDNVISSTETRLTNAVSDHLLVDRSSFMPLNEMQRAVRWLSPADLKASIHCSELRRVV